MLTTDAEKQPEDAGPLVALLNDAETMAREILSNAKEVAPFLLCERVDGERTILAYEAAATSMLRRVAALALGKLMRETGTVRFIVIREAWVSESAYDTGTLPSKSADRIDALTFEAHDVGGNFLIRVFRIDRSNRHQPSLELIDNYEGARRLQSGTWDNLLTEPEKVMH